MWAGVEMEMEVPAAAPWKALQLVLPRCKTSCVEFPSREALLTSLTASSSAAFAARPIVELKASRPPMPTTVGAGAGAGAHKGAAASSCNAAHHHIATTSAACIADAPRHRSHMLAPPRASCTNPSPPQPSASA